MLKDKVDSIIKNLKKDGYRRIDELSKYVDQVEDLAHLLVYKKFRESSSISFDSFRDLEPNERLEFPSTNGKPIYATKFKESEHEIEFNAEFSEGSILYRHRHNDCDEVMTVTSDSIFKFMLGKESNGTLQSRILVKGDVIIIKATIDHQIINLGEGTGHIHAKLIRS